MRRAWMCDGRGEIRIISGPMDDPQRELRDMPAWFREGPGAAVPDVLIRPVVLDPERVRAAMEHWRRVLPDRRG